jgi:predicted SAM-dependent methyltransferase
MWVQGEEQGGAEGSPAQVPEVNIHMRPPRYICACGYVGKTLGLLNKHQQECQPRPVKLNLGCGTVIKKGFINIDIRDLPGVDIVHDVSNLSDLNLVGIEYILADDIIEHFSQEETATIIAHWVSLLILGGIIEIRCPDILHAVKVAPSPEWLIRLIYGGQDYPENFHKAGFTLKSMKKLLKKLGLQIIYTEQTSEGNLVVKAQK